MKCIRSQISAFNTMTMTHVVFIYGLALSLILDCIFFLLPAYATITPQARIGPRTQTSYKVLNVADQIVKIEGRPDGDHVWFHNEDGAFICRGKVLSVDEASSTVRIPDEISSDTIAHCHCRSALAKGTMYVISVGINRYHKEKTSGWNLTCAKEDAELFQSTMLKAASPVFDITTKLLTDENASAVAIGKAFRDVANSAKLEDTLVFSFSGQGLGDRNRFGLVPYCGPNPSTEQLESQVITASQLTEMIEPVHAKNIVLLFDTAHSAALSEAMVDMLDSKAVIVISARESIDLDMRDGRTKHGLLTYCASQGLAGGADLSGNGLITALELENYLPQKVAEVREKYNVRAAIGAHIAVSHNLVIGSAKPISRVAVNILRAHNNDEASGNSYPKANLALLFATSNYKAVDTWPFLPNPPMEIDRLKKVLQERYAWEAQPYIDCPKKKIIAEILAALKKKPDQLLIYFSGHGYWDEEQRQGFIVTGDSLPLQEDIARDSYINYSWLRDVLDRSDCKHILLALDACYSGTFLDQIAEKGNLKAAKMYDKLSLEKVVEQTKEHWTRLVAVPTPKDVTFDGASQGSPFALHVYSTLDAVDSGRGFIRYNDLKTAVEDTQPGGRMAHFGKSDGVGDFLFVPSAKPQKPNARAQKSPLDELPWLNSIDR